MNSRERFVATVLFQNPDRIPFLPGRPRESTLQTWYQQGLPEGVEWYSYLTGKLDIEQDWLYADTHLGINFLMIPQFEEKVLDRREGVLVVQDWKGNICEISDKYDVTYLRKPVDFVTRKWVKCPVENWADWEQMKERYDPRYPMRFPADFKERCRILQGRDRVAGLFFNGPFMQLREWLGFEGLCLAFMDHPELVQDMLNFWKEFISRMLEKCFDEIVPDYVHVGEDMAYKQKTMISPVMTREFMLPLWRQWGNIVHEAGCPVFDIDSDGYIGELIPIWIDAGFDLNDPVKVAAGNDLVAFGELFGKKMAYLGGVDKRAMAKGGDAIKEEMKRLAPTVNAGGYIPSCDHGIPPDVS